MASKHQEVDVLDNWEDIEESDVLERKFSSLRPPSKGIETKSCCNGTNRGPINIILTGDDALRSQYVPPEPTVTILKRPTTENHISNDNKVYQPKPLKQREQEYAEARLRILGEAPCPDSSVEESKVPNIQRPRIDADTNVIRLPRGPDSSKGFTSRR